tara:strand:- start:7550 stop:7723 length:174 start_codon:yes stop_codon:yes gene_type:complete
MSNRYIDSNKQWAEDLVKAVDSKDAVFSKEYKEGVEFMYNIFSYIMSVINLKEEEKN